MVAPLQMNTGALLFEGIRDLDWKIVRKSLPPLKTVLSPAKNPSLLLQGIELEQDHRYVLGLIDGRRSIEELCVLSDIGDYSTLKVLCLLTALRLAEVTGAKTAEEVKQAVHHLAAGEKQETAAGETPVTKETILHAFNNLEAQDYYEMLGIGRSVTPQEIKKAYFRLAKIYHPDRHSDTGLKDMKPTLEKLFGSINEAYNVLSAEDKREQYNIDITSGIKKHRQEKRTAAEKDDDTRKGSASVQFNEGMKQYRARNFWGAEESFRWAVRLDPSNPEFVFHQGLALANMPRRRHEAEEHFLKAIKMAPSKIEFYLELGNFYAKNGLKSKALSVYQNALRHSPDSDRIRQAIRNTGE
jgi:curved DNA-binding protein CbpA